MPRYVLRAHVLHGPLPLWLQNCGACQIATSPPPGQHLELELHFKCYLVVYQNSSSRIHSTSSLTLHKPTFQEAGNGVLASIYRLCCLAHPPVPGAANVYLTKAPAALPWRPNTASERDLVLLPRRPFAAAKAFTVQFAYCWAFVSASSTKSTVSLCQSIAGDILFFAFSFFTNLVLAHPLSDNSHIGGYCYHKKSSSCSVKRGVKIRLYSGRTAPDATHVLVESSLGRESNKATDRPH